LSAGYSEDLAGRGHDEGGAAGFAPVVGIDAVVGLLFSDEVEGLVLADGHRLSPTAVAIYGFGGTI
jgi:hypothetical protein